MGTAMIDLGTITGSRRRPPTGGELVEALRDAAYACASINAAVCANHPPRLYLRNDDNVTEVLHHPALTLLREVNPEINGYDLLELTTLNQEVNGSAYWYVERDALNTPATIWPLASHCVTREATGYVYRINTQTTTYSPTDIIHFRYPDPRNPYGVGLSPMRAAYEQVILSQRLAELKLDIYSNRAVPGLIISPDEAISAEERERLAEEYKQKFTRGSAGRTLVTETKVTVHTIKQEFGDLASLAEQSACKEAIANAFGVPLAMLTKDTNLANLQASLAQHAILTIRPRLTRRDEKLNERLIPMYDDSGRLYFASDDPADMAADARLGEEKQDLETGVRTINEVRALRGLAPVAWGESPWLPISSAQTDLPRRSDAAPRTGRNANIDRGENDAT